MAQDANADNPSGLPGFYLFNFAPEAMSISVLGPDGGAKNTYWNRAWFDAFGYHPEQVQGRNGVDFGFWPRHLANMEALCNAYSELDVRSDEVELRCADGSPRQVVTSGRRVKALEQSLLMVSYRDVTQQHLLEAERVAREENLHEFRVMVQYAHDAMLLVENDVIVECNLAAQQLFGVPREMLIGRTPEQFSTERQDSGESSATQARANNAVAAAGTVHSFLWKIRRADGCIFTTEITLCPADSSPTRFQSGRQRVVAIVHDVTESLQAERALQASEQRFRQLFELAPVALLLVQFDGVVITVNRKFVELLGYSLDEIRHPDDWYPLFYPDPEYRAQMRARTEQSEFELIHQGGENRGHEARVRCKNGEDRILLMGGARVDQEMLIFFHDVTEIRAAQERLNTLNAELETRVQERTQALQRAIGDLKHAQKELVRSEKLAGLGALVAGVAHELNTPIGNAVMVASTMNDLNKQFSQSVTQGLRRSVLDQFIADWREATDVIERNLSRAAELISSFKQVAVDQSSYQRRPFDLADVLHELRVTLSPTLKRSQVVLSEDVSPGLYMDSFPGPLTQVLMNVVNNAVVHAFEGGDGGLIHITGHTLPDRRVRITVGDNGCGISSSHLERIFDPFFTTKLGRGGSGLGLHIVYSLVTELLGGTVQVESQSGAGCTVTIDLPLRAPGEPAVQ